MRNKILIITALLCMWAGATPLYGQDEEERPVLPDIAPRTVEIRGQLEIHFPTLERQPLVGFNPPPRIVDLGDRQPFMEPYRQGAADLPQSPLQEPTALAFGSLEGIERRTGIVEARAGRYLSRHVDARVEHAFRPEVAVVGRLRYSGLDGHEPYEFDPHITSSSDDIEGRADVLLFGEAVRGGIGIDGLHSRYALFGAVGSNTSPQLNDAPMREGRQLGATAWIQTAEMEGIAASARARLSNASFNTDACADESSTCLSDRFQRAQRTFELAGDVRLPLDRMTLFAEAEAVMSGIDTGALAGTDVVTTDAAAGLRLIQSRRLAVRAAGRFLLAHAPSGAGSSSRLYVSPDVRIDVYPMRGFQLYVENRPSIRHTTLAQLHRRNPYIVSRPVIQPEVTTIDARAGVRLFTGPATVDVRGGYAVAPEFQYFEHREASTYVEGVSAVGYDKASILQVGGELSMVLGGRANAGLSADFRHGRLTEHDSVIPYFSPLVGRAMLSIPLMSNRVVISGAGRFESARYRDRDESRRIGDYMAFDFRGTYRVNPMIGIVAAVENLSVGHLEKWDRYPLPPAIVTGGIRLSW